MKTRLYQKFQTADFRFLMTSNMFIINIMGGCEKFSICEIFQGNLGFLFYLLPSFASLRLGTWKEISMIPLFSSLTRISLMAGIEFAGDTPLLPVERSGMNEMNGWLQISCGSNNIHLICVDSVLGTAANKLEVINLCSC